MELKIDNKIAYAGEDMKMYLIDMLERMRYNYIIDTDEQMITVLKKPHTQTANDYTAELINRLFDVTLTSVPLIGVWSRLFPGIILTPNNELFKALKKNQKLAMLITIITQYTSDCIADLYNSSYENGVNFDKVELANEILEIISNHYDIKEKTNK